MLALIRFGLSPVVFMLMTSCAFCQQRQLNVIRIEPIGEGEGQALQLNGFYYVGSPNFSPDGEWVAFDGYKGTDAANVTSECWIAKKDGTKAKRLARGATPRWSPDGKQLLFMREDRDDLGRPGGDNVGVYIVDMDGKNEKRLFDGRWPEFSPDGKQIVYSVGGEPRGGSRPGSRVCVVNADGTDVRDLAIGDCPSWSPDGKKIACCYSDPALGAPMIRIVNLENNEQTLIGYGWFRANWSPDSKSVYANGVVNGNQPGMVRLSTGQRAQPEPVLTKFVGQSPCPSPDGKSLVFCTTSETPARIQ